MLELFVYVFFFIWIFDCGSFVYYFMGCFDDLVMWMNLEREGLFWLICELCVFVGVKFIIIMVVLMEKIVGVDLLVVIFGDDEVVFSFGSRVIYWYFELLRIDINGVLR